MTTKHLILVRAFPTDIERTGPRQLTGRLVPYDVPTDVADEMPDGEWDIYQEGFRPGAFGPQANTTEKGVIAKIGLVHRHEGGLGFLGPFSGLREAPDGLYGDVAVLRSKAGDVEDLLAEGVDELSIEFRVPKANGTEIGPDGIRWRTRAHLDQVALEPKGAYRTAQVLAYRAELDELAKAQAETEAANAAAEAERARVEAAAEAAEGRRARFNELAGRLEGEQDKQAQLVRQYMGPPASGHR